MTVTIRDLARASGYSLGTISRALKNQNGLSEGTREKIHRIAIELGYDFGNLRKSRVRRVAFLLHRQHNTHTSSHFYSPVLHGAEEACRHAGAALSFIVLDPGTSVLDQIRRHQPDAILCAGFFEPELLDTLRKTGKPLVLADSRLQGYASVNPDNRQGGYLATRHLIESGRKRIAMLSGPLSHYSTRERSHGYRKALFHARMLADPDLEISLSSLGDHHQNVIDAVNELFALAIRPDALFCYNDSTALIAMRHCLEMGFKIPHDVAIVGFDNIGAASAAVPPLTSIDVDKAALGRASIELLLGKTHAAQMEKILGVELKIRESSCDD